MIGVVIPAHNEAHFISACVASIVLAARHPGLGGEQVQIFVVLDSCSDETGAIARSLGAQIIAVEMRNVGAARATGAQAALAQGARWLAFSDADTTVAEDWLVQQLNCRADAVCGVISIENWAGHCATVQHDFTSTYRDRDGHGHIHGANLGVSAVAYRAAGGFRPLVSNEDVAFVEALIVAKVSIVWSAATRVITSARLDSRAPSGFGATLRAVSLQMEAADEFANDASL